MAIKHVLYIYFSRRIYGIQSISYFKHLSKARLAKMSNLRQIPPFKIVEVLQLMSGFVDIQG